MAKAERMIIEMQHQQQEQQQQHQDQHFIIAGLQERLNRALQAAATGQMFTGCSAAAAAADSTHRIRMRRWFEAEY